jgi:hypothetical protein
MTLSIVMAVGKDAFVPVAVYRDKVTDECYTKPLVVDDNDDSYKFMKFEEAQRVANIFSAGPEEQCGNVRHAQWENHYTKWGWDILDVFPTKFHDEDREDFHADL